MLKYQQFVLTLTILSFNLNTIEAENSNDQSLKHQEDYKPSMEKSFDASVTSLIHYSSKLAKMEPISKNPLPFNPLLILLGSIIALVIVSATIGIVACHKKRTQNGSFKRLNEDPEGNETNANPANAVIWSLSNDQLIMVRYK